MAENVKSKLVDSIYKTLCGYICGIQPNYDICGFCDSLLQPKEGEDHPGCSKHKELAGFITLNIADYLTELGAGYKPKDLQEVADTIRKEVDTLWQ